MKKGTDWTLKFSKSNRLYGKLGATQHIILHTFILKVSIVNKNFKKVLTADRYRRPTGSKSRYDLADDSLELKGFKNDRF